MVASDPTQSTIKLTWTAPGFNACGAGDPTYDIRYSTSEITGANWAQASQANSEPVYAAGSQTMTLGTCQGFNCNAILIGCTKHWFGLKSSVSTVTSGLSNIVNKYTTGAPQTGPQNPTATAGTNKVTLDWQAPSTADLCELTPTNYEIWRGTASDEESLLTTVGNVLTYDDTTGEWGTTYYYKIKVKTSGGTSTFSGEVSAAPESGITVPSAPTLLSVTASDKKNDLSWSAPASDGGAAITSQKIYRGTQSGVLSLVKTFNDGTTTTYSDTGLTNDQVYYYKISAVNSAGEGTKSNEMSGTPFAPSATKCSDGTDFSQCSTNKPSYCANGNLTSNATACGCPAGQTASGNTCVATVTQPTEPTQPTETTQPTEPTTITTPTDGTGLEQPEDFDVLEGKARSAITVAESAIKVAKDDKKDVGNATKLYNEAVTAYNSEQYQTAIDKAKEAADSATQAKLLTAPSAELPITAIVALIVIIAVGGGVVYYYKKIYQPAHQGGGQPEPQTPAQRR